MMQNIRGLAIVAAISYPAILVLVFGALGIHGGNQIITAALILIPLAILATSPMVRVTIADVIFAGFVALVAGSFAVNGMTADLRDYALLAVSLAAYPAFRGIGQRFSLDLFILVTGAIVLAGTIATAWALYRGHAGADPKPDVFGFGDAATYFLMSLGFLLLAMLAFGVPTRVVCAVITLPSIVFASAMVRHPFLAIVAGLAAMTLTSSRRRRYVAVAATLAVSIAIGLATRPETSAKLINFAISAAKADTIKEPPPPSCGINMEDTIAMRKALYREALPMMLSPMPVGIGLGSFAQASCLKMYPHNIFVQTAVEFGIPATLLLLMILALSVWHLIPAAMDSKVWLFVLGGLVFVTAEAVLSGALAGATLLFGFMGWASGANAARTANDY